MLWINSLCCGQRPETLFACLFAQRVKDADNIQVHDALAVDVAGSAQRAAVNDFKQLVLGRVPVKLTLEQPGGYVVLALSGIGIKYAIPD